MLRAGLHGPRQCGRSLVCRLQVLVPPQTTPRVGNPRNEGQHASRRSSSHRTLRGHAGPPREVHPRLHFKKLPEQDRAHAPVGAGLVSCGVEIKLLVSHRLDVAATARAVDAIDATSIATQVRRSVQASPRRREPVPQGRQRHFCSRIKLPTKYETRYGSPRQDQSRRPKTFKLSRLRGLG